MANSWDRSGAHRDIADQFHSCPGYQLMAALREHAAADDAHAAATLSRRITRARLIGSFRQNAGTWDAHEDGEDAGEPLHPAFTRADLRDLIADRGATRDDLRDLLRDRIERRNDLRDLISDRVRNQDDLGPLLDRIRDRLGSTN
jgi:hypothetical protein